MKSEWHIIFLCNEILNTMSVCLDAISGIVIKRKFKKWLSTIPPSQQNKQSRLNYEVNLLSLTFLSRDRRGRDRMVVGFTTIYAISAYHHWCCEFESRLGEVYSIQHYVLKYVSDLRQICDFLRVLQFPPSIKLTPRYTI
jgi:hypothetical protein